MKGSVNVPGASGPDLKKVKEIADSAKTTANSALKKAEGAATVDEGSTVTFSIGCDDNGVYIVTPDE